MKRETFPHPSAIDAAKRLADYADGMNETRAAIDREADAMRARQAANVARFAANDRGGRG